MMPVGEHLLKIVEQLEIATSSADDTLAAFHAATPADAGAQDVWWSLGGEMRRLGGELERAALGRAELSLREGVVGERAW